MKRLNNIIITDVGVYRPKIGGIRKVPHNGVRYVIVPTEEGIFLAFPQDRLMLKDCSRYACGASLESVEINGLPDTIRTCIPSWCDHVYFHDGKGKNCKAAIDLGDIANEINLQMFGNVSMNFLETEICNGESTIYFSVSSEFEVIDAFTCTDKVIVVVLVNKFETMEFFFNTAIHSFQRRIRDRIIGKIPEAEDVIQCQLMFI